MSDGYSSLVNGPEPALAPPPGVTDTGAQGNILRYAMENHTHASKARKARITGISTSTYLWTFPTPFTAGAVPICIAIAEDPANSATDSYNVQVVGAPTNSQVTFRIVRQTSGLFGLLTGAIGFNPAPGTVALHMIALEP